MAARGTMAALITRVRLLINDPSGAGQIFADQDIQDVMDATRQDLRYVALAPSPSYSGASIQYLDYFSDLGDWEDDVTFKQYRITTVTPSVNEPIAGHWIFAATTLPPVYIIGKTYDVYRSAADLLERWAARWTLSFSFTSDGQSFQRSQVAPALQALAHTYRLKQRATMIGFTRSDEGGFSPNQTAHVELGPQSIDYESSG